MADEEEVVRENGTGVVDVGVMVGAKFQVQEVEVGQY